MKVIFLDIDGVVNNASTTEKHDGIIGIDQKNLMLLKQIIDATGAKIVLSSDWRWGWMERDNGSTSRNVSDFNYLEKKFAEVDLSFLSRTPFTASCERGNEISMWLKRWGGEPIDKFIIIDDIINDIITNPSLKGHVIQTSWKKGLKKGAVNMAVQMLGKKEE